MRIFHLLEITILSTLTLKSFALLWASLDPKKRILFYQSVMTVCYQRAKCGVQIRVFPQLTFCPRPRP